MSAVVAVPTRAELIQAQRDLCKSNGWPHFAPHDGTCYHCKQDIVTEAWAYALISGCQKCHMSYCD